MIDNYWINIEGNLYPGVMRYNGQNYRRVIFLLQGFSYSMCDKDYFMTRLANRLCNDIDMIFQFDVSGHGDSFFDLGEVSLEQIVNDITQIIKYLSGKGKEIVVIGRGLLTSLAYKSLADNDFSLVKYIISYNPYFIENRIVKDFYKKNLNNRSNLVGEMIDYKMLIHILHSLGTEYDNICGSKLNKVFWKQLSEYDVLLYYNKLNAKKILLFPKDDWNYSLEIVTENYLSNYRNLELRLDAMLPENAAWQNELIEKIKKIIQRN